MSDHWLLLLTPAGGWPQLAVWIGVPLLALSTAQDLIEQLRDHLSGPQAGKRA